MKFFESEIAISASSDNINDSYEYFFSNLKIKDRDAIVSFDKQSELFSEISPNLFNKIWYYEMVYIPKLDDSVQTIYYQSYGKYFEFLDAASEKDKGMEKYYNDFLAIFDAGPTLLAYSMKDYKKYDIGIERNRLIISINYLYYNEYLRLDSLKKYQ